MAVDASAVARVLGIETKFEDLRAGGVLFLPQRIAVIAQGASSAVYATTKFQATRSPDVGAALGYGSPAHLIARMLFPDNGDGVGTIPVTFYPLDDDAAGVAAAGDITPSGSQTKAASYRVLVNNILSEAFVIPIGASVTDVCRLVGEAIRSVLHMPVSVTWTYGAVTVLADPGNTGNGTVQNQAVNGTPLPGAYTLECTAAAVEGGTFKLTDPNGTVVADDLTLDQGALGVNPFTAGGIDFEIVDGAVDYAVGDSFTLTVPATDVTLTAKWKGVSGNDIHVEVQGEDLGTTFAITQPTGGLVNPDVQGALDQIGNVWESLVLNGLNIEDTTALGKIQTVGDGRWGELVRKPFVAFTGVTKTTVAEATAVSSARTTDKVNAQLVAPGSNDLPCVVAARQLARIARVANNNPPTDYGAQRATGLTPGADADQWTYAQRDQAVKAGSSTIEVKDGVINIGDVVTFYRPTGEPVPAYRYVVDIVKLQNIIFNLDVIFGSASWVGAPLIPDTQPTSNPNARKPKHAKAAANGMIDSLGLNAIISDPKTAKSRTTAAIDSQNPKRLNVSVTVQLAGNSNIIDVILKFGFFFGEQALAA